MRHHHSTGKNHRRLAALTLAAAAASTSGCEWSLSIETGGASLVEQIIEQFGNHISGNEIVPNGQPPAGGGVSGPAGAAGGGGGGGGASGGPSGPTPAPVTPPQVADRLPTLPDPVFALVAGRTHRVLSLSAAPAAPGPGPESSDPAVLITARTTPAAASTGVVAECALRVPANLWPADASGAPLAVSFASGAPSDAPPAPGPGADVPDTFTLGGRMYALSLASVRLDRGVGGQVRGVIEAVARRTGESSGASPQQLIRIVFAPPAESHR